MKRHAIVGIGLALLASLAVPRATAHPAPDAAVVLDFHQADVGAQLRLPLAELELAFGRPLAQDPAAALVADHDALERYVVDHVRPVSAPDRPWAVTVTRMAIATDGPSPSLIVDIAMRPPPGASPRRFTLRYDVIAHQIPNHIAMIAVGRDWSGGLIDGDEPRLLGSIRYFRPSVDVDLGEGSTLRGFMATSNLGMHHIAEGTDHLLFLLVLMLTAPLFARNGRWAGAVGVRDSGLRMLTIVSAFTVGHSITLCAGALGITLLPQAVVESSIAVSILVTAVHAWRPLFASREAWVAGAFGLVHGLAFARVVADLGLDGERFALAVLGFNLGIEFMQLVVIACVVPWLVLLARSAAYILLRNALAGFAGFAAIGWLIVQLTGHDNVVVDVVEAVATRWHWWLAALIGASLATTLASRVRSRLPSSEAA